MAGQFLINSPTTAKEMLTKKFALVSFSMTSLPIEEFAAIFKMEQAEICLAFGHVTFDGSF